jgi:hypothetical protein
MLRCRESSHRQTTDDLVRHPHSRTCFTCLRALSISSGRVRTRSFVAQAWRMPCPRVPDWCAAALNATARERLDAWWRCNSGAARDGPRAFMRCREGVVAGAARREGGGRRASDRLGPAGLMAGFGAESKCHVFWGLGSRAASWVRDFVRRSCWRCALPASESSSSDHLSGRRRTNTRC